LSGGAVSYVLPLRWDRDRGLAGLATYLERAAGWPEVAEVIVVDGSPGPVFERNAEALAALVRHIRPDPDLDYSMGKVNGVVTGVRHAGCEAVVIADDDVRYERSALEELARRLGSAHLVVPQNYFDPLPWHARWDTARTLLNRIATGDPEFPAGDFPGTLAVRKGFFVEIGAYDGDLIFENLELMRTFRAAGGTVDVALDLFVRRLPPEARHFVSQRVRQAYDDFAIPLRMAAWLSVWPLVAGLAARRRWAGIAGLAAASALLAEAGRRRAGGTAVYPASGSLMAPAWIAERATCAWLAAGQRLRGGTTYNGGTIARSATPARELRRRYREAELSALKRTDL
jgi:hypothetical protein